MQGRFITFPSARCWAASFGTRIRCYADTTESDDPRIYGQRLKARKEQGFTRLKMDLGLDLMNGQEGLVKHADMASGDGGNSMPGQGGRTVPMLTGIEITPLGIDNMAEFAAAVREYVGYDIRFHRITSGASA